MDFGMVFVNGSVHAHCANRPFHVIHNSWQACKKNDVLIVKRHWQQTKVAPFSASQLRQQTNFTKQFEAPFRQISIAQI